MPDLITLLTQYGHALVFGWVLLESLGLPIPSTPLLVTAGALAARGQLQFAEVVGLYVAAACIGDVVWYLLGLRSGGRILRVMCSISLEPDTCVRQTQGRFDQWGLATLLFAKFIPGLSTVASPLAGVNRAPITRFLSYDLVGSVIYGMVIIGTGHLFSAQVEKVVATLEHAGRAVFFWLGLALGLYIAFKAYTRAKFLRSLEMPRMGVVELKQRLDAGEALLVVDVRHIGELRRSVLIPQARHYPLERIDEVPLDHPIVLYCACPHEASSARAAQRLKARGGTAWPLEGGLDAWTDHGYPIVPYAVSPVDEAAALLLS